jgi:hypothetical protein
LRNNIYIKYIWLYEKEEELEGGPVLLSAQEFQGIELQEEELQEEELLE